VRLDPAVAPDFLPRSLSDAHRVLNVNSAAPKQVVEKLVTCLRQVWHPDRGPAAERPLRTMKLQQINAAWDIVTGKRAAADGASS
jgi:DnaJ-class molecular chaperone